MRNKVITWVIVKAGLLERPRPEERSSWAKSIKSEQLQGKGKGNPNPQEQSFNFWSAKWSTIFEKGTIPSDWLLLLLCSSPVYSSTWNSRSLSWLPWKPTLVIRSASPQSLCVGWYRTINSSISSYKRDTKSVVDLTDPNENWHCLGLRVWGSSPSASTSPHSPQARGANQTCLLKHIYLKTVVLIPFSLWFWSVRYSEDCPEWKHGQHGASKPLFPEASF